MQWPKDTASADYAPLVLNAIRSGNFSVRWGTVTSEYNGHTAEFAVFADALKIDDVRISVSAEIEQQIADLLNCSLLTPKLADLLWFQRGGALLPMPRPITSMSAEMVDQSKKIDAEIVKLGNPQGLVSTVGKHWVITQDVLQHPGRATNYGWHFPGTQFGGSAWEPCVTGKCRLIQGQGWFHDMRHLDYSQNCVLVSRSVIVDGREMDLHELLTSKELAPLASHSGAMTVLRQPGVAEAPALYTACRTASCASPLTRVAYHEPGTPEQPAKPTSEGPDWRAVAVTGGVVLVTVAAFLGGLAAMGKPLPAFLRRWAR